MSREYSYDDLNFNCSDKYVEPTETYNDTKQFSNLKETEFENTEIFQENLKAEKAYKIFAETSIKTLESNLETLSKNFFFFKNTMGKFLNGQDMETFLKFENDFEDSEREMLNLLSRLRKNEFEVIFVGAEKAGKSTLISSYLNCPKLLPSGVGRCTYTATEILPSVNNKEELVVVTYFNQNEFEAIIDINDQLLGKLESATSSENRADLEKNGYYIVLHEEKAALEKCLHDEGFKELLNKEKEAVKFKKSDIEAVKQFLKNKVTHTTLSRAIKKISFHTTLFASKNVLIYDLPGFDSPTKIHKDLATKRCESADAIVYVKECLRPSLPLQEIEMLDTFKNYDHLIPFEEKVILALTGIDRLNEQEDFYNMVQISRKEWGDRYKLSAKKIAFVCNQYDNENNKKKLKEFGLNDSGILKLDRLIDYCKYQSRLKSLSRKVSTVTINFDNVMEEFVQFSEQNFPQDLTNNSDTQLASTIAFAIQQEENKARWWNKEWKTIHEKFSKFYKTINGNHDDLDLNLEVNDSFASFKSKYQEMVDKMFEEIRSKCTDRFKSIYGGKIEAGGVLAPGEGHVAIRIELSEIVYQSLAKILAAELSTKIWETISKMLNWILEEMYCIKEIKENLLQDTEKNAKRILEQQIGTLILRVARPAVELFIRFPRHDGRTQCMKRFSHEVLILDMFYKNEKTGNFESKGLEWFLLAGKFKKDSQSSLLSLDIDKLEQDALKLDPDAFRITKNFKEAQEQIENDLNEFQDYMKYSVFYGSGLEAFFRQELDKLKKRFASNEKDADMWRIFVYKEIEAGNPNIPYTQLKLQEVEKFQICKEVQDLKKKLKKHF